nr:hypothetical protein CFP56_14907 [Quercus suber]
MQRISKNGILDNNEYPMQLLKLIESHLALLKLLPVGSPGHMHVLDVLKAVDELGCVAVANAQANNGHETESIAIASLSTNAAPGTLEGRSGVKSSCMHEVLLYQLENSRSPSGRRVATPPVVTSPRILAAILHASHQLEVPSPILDAYPQLKVPPPTPPLQPSFDLGIEFNLTPPMHPETPSYSPTSSSAPTLPINPPRTEPMTMIPSFGFYTELHDPPTSSLIDPLGPLVGTDTLQPEIDVLDKHPPH